MLRERVNLDVISYTISIAFLGIFDKVLCVRMKDEALFFLISQKRKIFSSTHSYIVKDCFCNLFVSFI